MLARDGGECVVHKALAASFQECQNETRGRLPKCRQHAPIAPSPIRCHFSRGPAVSGGCARAPQPRNKMAAVPGELQPLLNAFQQTLAPNPVSARTRAGSWLSPKLSQVIDRLVPALPPRKQDLIKQATDFLKQASQQPGYGIMVLKARRRRHRRRRSVVPFGWQHPLAPPAAAPPYLAVRCCTQVAREGRLLLLRPHTEPACRPLPPPADAAHLSG